MSKWTQFSGFYHHMQLLQYHFLLSFLRFSSWIVIFKFYTCFIRSPGLLQLSVFLTWIAILTCHNYHHHEAFYFTSLCFSITNASELEEIPNPFLPASSLKMFSSTILMIITSLGAQLTNDTTNVSQVSMEGTQ